MTVVKDSPKVAAMKRLHREGRHDDYVTKREALKLDGVDPIEAWRHALAYFPPLDGSPPEFDDLPAAAIDPLQFDSATIVVDKPPLPKKYKPVATVVVDPLDAIFLDGDAQVPDPSPPADAPIASVEPELTPAAAKKKRRAEEAAAKAALDPTDDPEQEDYSDLTGNEAAKELAIFARLHKKIPKARRAKSLDVIDWVLDNLDEPMRDIHHKDIPSRGALAILRTARSSDRAKADFLDKHWSKTLPSKADMSAQGKSGDRHAKQYRMIDDFDRNFYDREDAEAERQEADE